MAGTIPVAMMDDRSVTLDDVQRGQEGLRCCTCNGRLVVKDGEDRAKHFSHTPSSLCHGEGPAHYLVKVSIRDVTKRALALPIEQRNNFGHVGRIHFRCPDAKYGPHDIIKFGPGSDGPNRQFEQMEHGYHEFDLLQRLARAECEVSFGKGRTRADVAGFDNDGNLLWVIEVKRSGLSKKAIEYACANQHPLFVVDLSKLPKPSEDDPWAELRNYDFAILEENLVNGFLPSVTHSYNTECERKAFGMGPTDQIWSKECCYIHKGEGDCGGVGCPDCEEVVLHECGEFICPDVDYMFQHDITRVQMHIDPDHWVQSHKPQKLSEPPVRRS